MSTPSETAGFSPASFLSRAELLDHAKHPRNRGELPDATIVHEETNPLCGDVTKVFVNMRGPLIAQMSFMGTGCLISQAAASMLTEHVVGKSVEEVLHMERADVERLLGTTLSPSRVKCAMLALVALKKALQHD